MTRISRVRIGVIGVGSLGFHHARILASMEGAELVGIHDADPVRLARVADELGANAYADRGPLLDSVDAAVVAVPTSSHAEVSLDGIERGVHLLIEKPIAATLEEADLIVARANDAGVLLATGHVERFNAALRACEPYLNEPIFIESHRLAPFVVRGTDVAVVLDLMIHDIDLVLSLVGRSVESVAAVGVPVLSPSADIANARLTFVGGAVANITASRVSAERMRKVRFFQRSGYISLDLAQGTGEFLRLRPDTTPVAAPAQTSLADLVERIELQGDGAEPLRSELHAFLAAVRGTQPLVVSGEDGRHALAVALEIMACIDRSLVPPRHA